MGIYIHSNSNGLNNISIVNLGVISIGTTTLAQEAGWICRKFFGNNVSGISIKTVFLQVILRGRGGESVGLGLD